MARISSIPTISTPSHVIIHVGTNNLPINTADECVKNIEDLAHIVLRQDFQALESHSL